MVTGDSNSGVISVLIVAKCNVNMFRKLNFNEIAVY